MGADVGLPFAAHFRHELRTLLTHVVGYTELLLEEADGARAEDAWATASLVAVTEAAGRAVAATDEVLHPTALDRATALAAVRRALDEVLVNAGGCWKAGPTNPRSSTSSASRPRHAPASHSSPNPRSSTAWGPVTSSRVNLTRPSHRTIRSSIPPSRWRRGPGDARSWSSTTTTVNRDLLVRRLERLGYEVRTANDGRQGLAVLCHEGADLVLLDLMMPEPNGYDVLEACREDERLRDIPIIMISARDQIDDVVECISLGAEDFLPKPVDPVLLDARVGACLEKKWLREQEHALLETVRDQASTLAEWNAGLEMRVQDQVAEIARLARLRRFLSPQVADVIVSTGEASVLNWHRSDIAVLFCDLRGFTAFAETVEPEEVMSVIGEFHGAIGPLVHQSDAAVGFFSGDGLMVFFNDPLPCPNPAERSVRLAVAMRDRMAVLISAWRQRGYDIGFGIGVTLGYATLGEIGFEGRSDYGVIGSVVNLAARLCDRAATGQILVSARALRAVEEVVEAEDVGARVLKGFSTPVAAFNVVGVKRPAG